MKSIERQQFLMAKAKKSEFVSIPGAAAELGVSVETIRRDINILSAQKQLKKVHGGAVPIKVALHKDALFPQRLRLHQNRKLAVVNEASKLIRDGDVVALDGGATTFQFAEILQDKHNVTFVINSLPLAEVLVRKFQEGSLTGHLIFIGGEINTSSLYTTDAYAIDALGKFHFDIAFLSCTSLSANSVCNTSLSIYSRHLVSRSTAAVLILDSSKLGNTSTYEFAKPTDFAHIIVDDQAPIPQDLLQLLEDSDTKLTVVHCD